MKKWLLAIFMALSGAPLQAGEAIPVWLEAQLPDRSVLQHPGVYPLKDGKLLGVGVGTAAKSMRESHAIRFSLQKAERDATYRIAKYLYPDEFSRHKTVAVDIRRRYRVFESSASEPERESHVAVVVDAGDVSVRPMLDASVIVDASRTNLPAEMFYYLRDPLVQLGGGHIDSFGEGWIAVAVGVAPLLGEDSPAERDAFKRARAEAGKALAETIFGSHFQVQEEGGESQSGRNGNAAFREWTQRTTREQIEGHLHHAVEAGYWHTDDGHVAVVLAVSDSPLDSLMSSLPFQDDAQMDIPDYPDWDVEPQWEFVLLSYPRLLNGGALVYPEPPGIYAVGIGVANLVGNPANDQINAPKAAEIDARRQIIKYLSGFSTQSDTKTTEEIEVIFAENGMESSSAIERLRKTTRENTAGIIRGLRKVGSWKSMDGKLLYQMHVVKIGNSD